MTTRRSILVVEAERLDDNLLITFSNGSSALYPSTLLYAMLPEAQSTAGFEVWPELDQSA